MNFSSPGSSDCGISQARTQEQIAIPFSRGSLWPGDHCVSSVSCFGRWVLLPLSHQGSPFCLYARYRNIYSITNSIDMNMSKLRELVEVGEDWSAAFHSVAKSWIPLSNLTINVCVCVCVCVCIFQGYNILLKVKFHCIRPNLLTQIEV